MPARRALSCFFPDLLDKPAILLPHLTAAGSGLDFQEGISTCQSCPKKLALRHSMQRPMREEYFCGELKL
jgi:hypothetical protein